MILKIERHNKEQTLRLFDNIADISCSKPKKYSQLITPSLLGEKNSIIILDHNPECSCRVDTEQCKDCITYYKLIYITRDNYKFAVIFDTVAYICNDEGVTIKEIKANCEVQKGYIGC